MGQQIGCKGKKNDFPFKHSKFCWVWRSWCPARRNGPYAFPTDPARHQSWSPAGIVLNGLHPTPLQACRQTPKNSKHGFENRSRHPPSRALTAKAGNGEMVVELQHDMGKDERKKALKQWGFTMFYLDPFAAIQRIDMLISDHYVGSWPDLSQPNALTFE